MKDERRKKSWIPAFAGMTEKMDSGLWRKYEV